MRFVSTNGKAPPADLKTAVLNGLAPDGGLYLPERLDPLPAASIAALKNAPLQRSALVIARHLLQDEPSEAELERVIGQAFDFPIPLVPFGERAYVLELFHGPTCAFKDVGARFMARLMVLYHARGEVPLTILVATSGDTGSAVAQAFFNVPGTRVFVLYPEGKVSPLQERQFTTLGGNITALAVDGTFDDCQRLVKEAFADPGLCDLRLTSANSINIARLLPQIFYYFHAWAQLPEPGTDLVVSVPSGNFGNLTAGLMAKRLGLPVKRFVAATNVNDVVPEYLRSGVFRPRGSVATLSNAMDVGNPSNFARMLWLYDGNLEHLRRDLEWATLTDAQVRAVIARTHAERGYLLDPHSAVAASGLGKLMGQGGPESGCFLATAHPAKFGEVVEPVIRAPVPLPRRLAECLRREPRVTRMGTALAELKRLLH